MNIIGAVRNIHFCSGHRVMNHESKCRTLHGHNYDLWIHARPKTGLDLLGRVIDFSVLKQLAGDWIDKNWDHTMILWDKDLTTIKLIEQTDKMEGKEIYLMPSNPTAENMADYFLKTICPDIFAHTDVEIYKVVLWETKNCYVEVSLSDEKDR